MSKRSDKDLLRPVVLSENWDEKKLRDIVRTAHRTLCMRPSYIAKSVFRIRSPAEFMRLSGLTLDVVKYSFNKPNNETGQREHHG